MHRQTFLVSSSRTVVGAASWLLLLLLLVVDRGVVVPKHAIVYGYVSNPELSRRDMAGLWRLTGTKSALPVLETTTTGAAAMSGQQPQQQYPMKEFTVYPKKKQQIRKLPPSSIIEQQETTKELLLMLLEDGSFKQYCQDNTNNNKATTTPKKKATTTTPKQPQEPTTTTTTPDSVMGLGIMKGTWDYLDGKLILAADRPPNAHELQVHDTMLVGKVVATSEQSMVENPIVLQEEEEDETSSSQKQDETQSQDDDDTAAAVVDTHLSVPKGSVKIGKFMYPKKHPSFFEQVMFQPTPTGSFQLSQVLGSLNTKQEQKNQDKQFIEKFHKTDFVDKRFLLTSHPIPRHVPKGNIRWSIKYNKFVRDPPPSTKQQTSKEQEEQQSGVPIRVMEMIFFQNNTFSTVAGLGSSIILRGKWDIRGDERDQLWMQVWRFGFGRSVSGSTYSEGMSLNKDDEKAYWGIISHFVVEKKKHDSDITDDNNQAKDSSPVVEDVTSSSSSSPETKKPEDEEEKRIEVKGSVLVGWGLEPEPVARFIMREVVDEELYDEEEEEDDDDEQDNNVAVLEDLMGDDDEDEDPEDDWSNAFQ